MTYIQALILGITQGLTEFFPVSSSAHLKLVKKFLDISDGEHLLYFDLICHLGTLIAALFFLRKEVISTLKKPREIALFSFALLPLIPVYFLAKPLRIFLSNPHFLGLFFLLTSALLFISSISKKEAPEKKFHKAFSVGFMQSLALIPGLSRSGSTIAIGRLQGWSFEESAKFSFLLAIPAILGGQALETLKILKGTSEISASLPLQIYAIGFFSSLAIGLFSVQAVFWIYRRNIVRPFAWYCFVLGILALTVFHG